MDRAASRASRSRARHVLVPLAVTVVAADPSTIIVAPGTVTFHVEDIGAQEHEFEILKGDVVIDEIG